MTLSKRLYWIAGLVAVFAIAAAAITMVSANSSAQSSPPAAVDDQADGETNDDADGVTDTNDDHADGEANDDDANEADGDNNEIDDDDGEVDDDNGDPADAGKLDDGENLLPQASITIEQAIAAAQTAADGDVGEVDLEYHDGKLVFNVDVGSHDVKVDAATGTVLGSGED
jgi:uncharacterized membrane protein YkoI